MCYASAVPGFRPFRALRYDAALAPLADLVAPPYDVVDAEERARLVARSPYNAIRVELPTPDAARSDDRYAAAAALLEAWQANGALRRDPLPALYVYKMGFFDEAGKSRATTGVIGALGLEACGGAVVPHEQTMSGPGEDRLQLLRACRVNCSPIWGLSLAPGLTAACATATERATDYVEATDDEATTHEMWRVVDESSISLISELIAPAPVVIADGHHRHETAIRYRAECRAHHDVAGGHDFVMAFIAELAPEQLAVRAIHRLVSGLAEGLDLAGEFTRRFHLRRAPSELGESNSQTISQSAPALVTRDGIWLIAPRANEPSKEGEPDSRVVDEFLAGLPAHVTDYEHGGERALAAVRTGRAQAAVLLRPPTVDQLTAAVRAGVRLPPKSTYFQPKPRTGFVFRPLAS
jgi:uncharacterized protein (DUF1015 family)